jgi:hypothetical protein
MTGLEQRAAANAVSTRRSSTRIRLGVLMVLFSWTPVASILTTMLGVFGADLSSEQIQNLHYACWAIQVPVGWSGVFVAGKETIDLAQSRGWRHVPRAMWALLRSPGSTTDETA